MLNRYQHTVCGLFRFCDATIVAAAWLGSYWLRFELQPIPVTRGIPGFETYAVLTPLVVVLWSAAFAIMDVYTSKRLLGRIGEARQLLRAHAVAFVGFVALTYFFEDYKYSRLTMGYFGILAACLLAGFRLALRTALRFLRARGVNLRRVVVVGEGEGVRSLIERLDAFPELGMRVGGVLTHASTHCDALYEKRVLGHYEDVQRVVRSGEAEEVIISLPPAQHDEIDRILELLKDETVNVALMPDVHRYVTLGCEVEDFDGLPMLRLNESPLLGWGAVLKRVTDLLFASTALVVLSPVLLAIAFLVKLTSNGPVLYVQERMGLDGRTFKMLKFRSMRVDAEDRSGAVWARVGDDRRTPIGTFLRQTSLDELPQLWNVLRGDMSLVGPRPERPVFVQQFRHEIPHYMLRHKVKAGLTGWAQVNGWRGNTSLVRRIECDLFYIRNWSYLLDLKIMTMTLWKGFVHKNAY